MRSATLHSSSSQMTSLLDLTENNTVTKYSQVVDHDTVSPWTGHRTFGPEVVPVMSVREVSVQRGRCSSAGTTRLVSGPRSLNMLPLGPVFQENDVTFHCFARDVHVYLLTQTSSDTSTRVPLNRPKGARSRLEEKTSFIWLKMKLKWLYLVSQMFLDVHGRVIVPLTSVCEDLWCDWSRLVQLLRPSFFLLLPTNWL